MLKKFSFALSCLALSLSTATLAAENTGITKEKSLFNYTFIEGNLSRSFNDTHMNGLGANFSAAIIPNLSIQGGINAGKESSLRVRSTHVEAAFHMPVGLESLKNTDFIAHAGVEYSYYRVKGIDHDTDTGVILGVGLRHQLIKNLEVFTDLSLHTVFNEKFSASTGAIYSVLPNLQVGGKLTVGRDDTLAAIVRYNF